MLNLLFQLLAELLITRPPGMEPGVQSPYARRALAELDSRYFRMALPRQPDAELGKLNRPSPHGHSRTRKVAEPSKASQAMDESFEWSCK